MPSFDDLLNLALDQRHRSGQLRALRPVERLPGGRIRVDGADLLDCASNDYLGLSQHPHLIAKSRQWAELYGAGAGASRLVTGHSPALHHLESRLAAAKGCESALILASGWQCNASIVPPLADPALWQGKKPVLLVDKLIHASLYAGCGLADAQLIRFRHNDLDHLGQLLNTHADVPKLVIVESVYSMDGDRADLAALQALCERHDAILYVDEAHATGVLGATGMGLSVGVNIPVVMGTFSKAMGAFGAYVAGSKALIDYLVNRASGFIYATALPPAALGAIDGALDMIPTLDTERQKVAAHADTLRRHLQRAGLNTGPSSTQIVPVILGDEATTLDAARRLKDLGILTIAIRPPTVPPGTSRLRISLSAAHSAADIEHLARSVVAVCGAA